MPLVLTRKGMRAVCPRAPQAVIAAFVEKQDVLAKAGLLETRPRLAFAFAIDGNRQRDARALSTLSELGWDVLLIWECEIARMPSLDDDLIRFLVPGRWAVPRSRVA